MHTRQHTSVLPAWFRSTHTLRDPRRRITFNSFRNTPLSSVGYHDFVIPKLRSSIGRINSLRRCEGSAFVSPSARICVVGVDSMLIRLLCTSCLSQCRWMSTCPSFVTNLGVSEVKARTLCVLSHWMYVSCPGLQSIEAKMRVHQMVSLAADDMAKSFAFVELFRSVFCLDAFQSNAPFNTRNVYPWELTRVSSSLEKEASLLVRNNFRGMATWASKSIARSLVWDG